MALWCYFLGGVLSLTVFLGITVYVLGFYRSRSIDRRTFAPPILYTIGLATALFILFLPVCYFPPHQTETLYATPLFLAMQYTLRVFILDGQYELITEAIQPLPDGLRRGWYLLSAILYILAPIMTFGNVLYLFKDFRYRLRYRYLCKTKHLYVMSELNVRSVAMADSILQKKEPDTVIIYSDVFLDKSEALQELYQHAHRQNAICLRQDIASMSFNRKKGPLDLFLIGSDEAENVAQATQLLASLNQDPGHQNVRMFTFAQSDASLYTLESQQYPELLKRAEAEQFGPNTFKMRRINQFRQLAWNTVPKMDLIGRARNDTVSVLLAGFGRYGTEFLKMLVWYCQVSDYRLEINIVDKCASPEGSGEAIQSRLRRECPELIAKNHEAAYAAEPDDGMGRVEAYYDIACYDGIDLDSDRFSDLLKEDSVRGARLRRTTHVIVALGDDDRNVEASVYLRMLFDRCFDVKADASYLAENERPDIFAVVYDEKKSSLIQGKTRDNTDFLRNHGNIPYHIHFIGSNREQFAYESIYDPELEKAAFSHHVSWADTNRNIKLDIQRHPELRKALTDSDWSEINNLCTQIDIQNARMKYEQHEYFRLASIAKELYNRMLKQYGLNLKMNCIHAVPDVLCDCEACTRRKRAEHVRWNAYMRANGFCWNQVKADRARYHKNLIPWDQLSFCERAKD